MLTKAEIAERVALYRGAEEAMEALDALKAAIPIVPPEGLIAGAETLADNVNEALTALLASTWSQVREALLYEAHQKAEHEMWRIQKFEAGEEV